MIAWWDGDDEPARWRDDALCGAVVRVHLLGLVAEFRFDTDVWFPVRQGDPAFAAKRVCAACPVRGECLDDALARGEEYGIWGGAGESVRRSFRRLDDTTREHALSRHFARLDLLADSGNQPAGVTVSFGPGASHGRASTFGRGCRCGPCRRAKSAADAKAKAKRASRRRQAS